MKRGGETAWHHVEAGDVARLLESDLRSGLSREEAAKRLADVGPNRLASKKGKSALERFLREFQNPLVYILLIAAAVTVWLGEHVDAGVIFGVVIANAIVGFIQEGKSEKAIAALTRMIRTAATVRRGGVVARVDSEELVPGDLVLLEAGDRVPADIRLFAVKNLQIDESALTGESLPVIKHIDRLAREAALADRKNLAFAGSVVTSGRAEGLVWATGDRTETGRIAFMITEAVDLSTPLTRKIGEFTRRVLVVILALAAGTFAVGIARGNSPAEMFIAAVALAVGAIPEGLPAAVTIALAIGVSRMAWRRAMIRKLPAVETIGGATVICSDKTGTLTENQMTVRKVFAGGKFHDVTGGGYDPKGEIAGNANDAALKETLLAGLLCNDSRIEQESGRWVARGDPTEAALIVAAAKAGLAHVDVHREHPRVDMIPFESEHMFRATLHHGPARRVIYKVGAVERLLERCNDVLESDGSLAPLDRAGIHNAVAKMAGEGLRVLAMARRHVGHDHAKLEHAHVGGGLTFLGLQGMIDPPRKEAVEAVRRCHEAGIDVKMITGDHLLTATVIARQIGLSSGDVVAVAGKEIAATTAKELSELAERATVFARVTPEDKLRLVGALQARGHVVAMTGDGVNDAPALKKADIGIAMGSGTDVAKGAADMLLTDDNFATIEAAVEEGRRVFDNLTKFIVWTIPTNLGEALMLLSAIVLGTTLPALPTQLLWVNLTTALLLGLMLVFEEKEKDVMRRPPRDPQEPILTFPLFMRSGLVSLIMLAGAFGLFLWEQRVCGSSIEAARTVVINVIVVVEIFYLLNCRSLTRSMISVGVFSNRWALAGIAGMIGAQLLFTYAPVMNRLFHTAPISAEAWGRILFVSLAAWAAVGFEKWVRFSSRGDGKIR